MLCSVRRLASRCGGRVVAGDTALYAFDRLAVFIAGDGALRDFSTAGQVVDREADLLDRELGRCGDFAVEQLAVFLEMLEDYIGRHAEPFQKLTTGTTGRSIPISFAQEPRPSERLAVSSSCARIYSSGNGGCCEESGSRKSEKNGFPERGWKQWKRCLPGGNEIDI